MASKGDLLEAQGFSRRRLLTAFVSGAPGGKELEPAKPMRAVIAGVSLGVLVLLVGVFWGLFQKGGLPEDWQNGKYFLNAESGARYVSVEGTLRPVINTTSARLLIGSAEKPKQVSSSDLNGIPIGAPIGIVGAPDTLPTPAMLVNTGWTACTTTDAGIDTRVSATPIAKATDGATVVENSGQRWIISGSSRFLVDGKGNSGDSIIRAVGLASTTADRSVSDAWLNLFTPGTPLAPIVIRDIGRDVGDGEVAVGDVVRYTGTEERYIVLEDGSLAPLTPLAYQLYQQSSGAAVKEREVASSVLKTLPTASVSVSAADWPEVGFSLVPEGSIPCAITAMQDERTAITRLAIAPAKTELTAGVHMDPTHGALVVSAGRGEQATELLTLIDATGTQFGIPGAQNDTVTMLGYNPEVDLGFAPSAWMSLFPAGPGLTVAAAGGPLDAAAAK